MTQLTCTNCNHAEYTAAPRHFRGDTCPECLDGVMLDNPNPKEEVEDAS